MFTPLKLIPPAVPVVVSTPLTSVREPKGVLELVAALTTESAVTSRLVVETSVEMLPGFIEARVAISAAVSARS